MKREISLEVKEVSLSETIVSGEGGIASCMHECQSAAVSSSAERH